MRPRLEYFAYGSNMLMARLRERAPSARRVCVGYVERRQLRWHKKGKDGSGKCDLYPTEERWHRVYGVLFTMSPADKRGLDVIEGLNDGYVEQTVEVVTANGTLSAVSYLATAIDRTLRPFDWYKRCVVEGAIEHVLPDEYVRELRRVEALRDPDGERRGRAASLFGGQATDPP